MPHDDGGGLFTGRPKAVESIKVERMGVKTVAITVEANKEKPLSQL
jgi:hypothetical protein